MEPASLLQKEKAEAGDSAAQYELAMMYLFGEGIEEDYVEAVKWFRKAAEQGNAEAQYQIGFFWRRSRGGLPGGLRLVHPFSGERT